jgi:hypothetical protein
MTPLALYYQDGLRAALQHLRELKLGVSWGWDDFKPLSQQARDWLPNFVRLAPQLEHLFLTGNGLFPPNYNSVEGFRIFSQMTDIPRLAKLELEHVIMAPENLLIFLMNHSRTLKYVSLAFMALEQGGWYNFLTRHLAEIKSLEATVHLRWLFELDEDEDGERLGYAMLMETDGIEDCPACGYEGVRKHLRCKHISKTLPSSSLSTLSLRERMEHADLGFEV